MHFETLPKLFRNSFENKNSTKLILSILNILLIFLNPKLFFLNPIIFLNDVNLVSLGLVNLGDVNLVNLGYVNLNLI